VEDLQEGQLDRVVKYAGNLCNECATDIVQNLAAISENQKVSQSQEVSQVILDFIGNYKKCILLQNLAEYAEMMDNIDTTQTTQSLLKLFGSAQVAIKNYTLKTKKSEPARFKYTPKASKKERGEGNSHPTVKPLELMKYLVKLVSPPEKGIILDPFLGSGTTGIACKNLSRNFIGIEKDPEYFKIAQQRIKTAEYQLNF